MDGVGREGGEPLLPLPELHDPSRRRLGGCAGRPRGREPCAHRSAVRRQALAGRGEGPRRGHHVPRRQGRRPPAEIEKPRRRQQHAGVLRLRQRGAPRGRAQPPLLRLHGRPSRPQAEHVRGGDTVPDHGAVACGHQARPQVELCLGLLGHASNGGGAGGGTDASGPRWYQHRSRAAGRGAAGARVPLLHVGRRRWPNEPGRRPAEATRIHGSHGEVEGHGPSLRRRREPAAEHGRRDESLRLGERPAGDGRRGREQDGRGRRHEGARHLQEPQLHVLPVRLGAPRRAMDHMMVAWSRAKPRATSIQRRLRGPGPPLNGHGARDCIH
mmetsp:Transcript_50275/g.134468  ORF Transcript_50275/g.134468 Transcript_50275/m.134468 type:complete len:327 (-) Transcript_50275:8-988(-)